MGRHYGLYCNACIRGCSPYNSTESLLKPEARSGAPPGPHPSSLGRPSRLMGY